MPLEVIHIFNDDCTCATYWCSGGLENFVFDLWHNRRRMRSSSAAIETHELCLEYALRHWAWLASPTWCRNPGKYSLWVKVWGAWWRIVACGARCFCVHWPVCGRGVATTSRARDRMGVAVGPRAWQCGTWMALVYSLEDLRCYGYRIRRGCGRVKPLCVYFPYYYHRRGYMELTACSSSQWVGVTVGPRAWQCGTWMTLVFSREDLRRYGYRIRLGLGCVKPLCVYFPYYYPGRGYMELTACSSSQWVGVAVGPRAWQCGTWMTLVFSREDLRRNGYRIHLGLGCVNPLCVYFPYYLRLWYTEPTTCSCQWVGMAGCWYTWVWWLWLRPLWVHHILITI